MGIDGEIWQYAGNFRGPSIGGKWQEKITNGRKVRCAAKYEK